MAVQKALQENDGNKRKKQGKSRKILSGIKLSRIEDIQKSMHLLKILWEVCN